jgi:hypothetical protein
MKTNFTYSLLLCLVLTIATVAAKAQVTGFPKFNMVPTLLSGTANQVGAKYRFSNVSTGTDAILTIQNATSGATISLLDDNSNAKPEAFSPNITVPANKNGYIEFKIDFVTTGTLTNIMIDTLFATAIDIDGTSTIKEYDVIDLGGGSASYMASIPEISITQSGTAFTGTNISGITYNGIDTGAKAVMFTVKKSNVTSFIYRAGVQNNSSPATTRLKSIYFKNFFYPAGASLPVKMTSFDAVAVDKSVLLKWVTAFEINNDHFEVERSFDGVSFSTVGVVMDGMQGGATQKTYQFKDLATELATKNVVYYRLKQVDNTGRVTYTNVVVVRFQATGGVVMQTSPNPFTENLNVGFSSTEAGNATINILNINGQKTIVKLASVSKGYNTIQIDGLSSLARGTYVAQLIVNGTVAATQKIIKN